jgi:carbon starvation protein
MLPFLSFTFASMIAVLALNTFVLTTLDSAVRITRFIVQESAGRKIELFQNKYVCTITVVFLSYLIGATDGWQKIWPIFGATNQLIAAMALFVVATWLMAMDKPTKFALYPAIFMVVTTIGALAWQSYKFYTQPEPNLFLGTAAVFLIFLALFVGYEGVMTLKGRNPELASAAGRAV